MLHHRRTMATNCTYYTPQFYKDTGIYMALHQDANYLLKNLLKLTDGKQHYLSPDKGGLAAGCVLF